jgi:hypothetical protein
MFMHTPAGCGCIPELDGGTGYVALAREGSRKVISDAERRWWDGKWKDEYDYAPIQPTSVLRKALSPEQLDAGSPIVSDWPESQSRTGLGKVWASRRYTGDGYAFDVYSSRFMVRVGRPDGPSHLWLTDGRVEVAPVVHNGRALVGTRTGTVSAYDLGTGELAWRLMVAPYDRRVYVAGQLEATWPVTRLDLIDGQLAVTAGAHLEREGGVFHYRLDPTDGTILAKRREYLTPDGDRRVEDIDLGREPGFDPPEPRAVPASLRRLRVEHTGSSLVVSLGTDPAAVTRVSVLDVGGRTLASRAPFDGRAVLPLAGSAAGRHLVVIESAGTRLVKPVLLLDRAK